MNVEQLLGPRTPCPALYFKVHAPGIEPRTFGWEADVLTTDPSVRLMTWRTNQHEPTVAQLGVPLWVGPSVVQLVGLSPTLCFKVLRSGRASPPFDHVSSSFRPGFVPFLWVSKTP